MGTVERAVRANLHEGEELQTPGQGKPWVDRIDERGLVPLLGPGGRHANRDDGRGRLGREARTTAVSIRRGGG